MGPRRSALPHFASPPVHEGMIGCWLEHAATTQKTVLSAAVRTYTWSRSWANADSHHGHSGGRGSLESPSSLPSSVARDAAARSRARFPHWSMRISAHACPSTSMEVEADARFMLANGRAGGGA